MRLEPADGISIDIDRRFRSECKGLPRAIRLEGNAMQAAVAEKLLERNAPHVICSPDGEPVRLMSLEAHGARFLETFLEGKPPVEGRLLLHTIPERLLVRFAEHYGVTVVREQKSPARKMLERIREEQPQTFFSLARSAGRIPTPAGTLPENGQERS